MKKYTLLLAGLAWAGSTQAQTRFEPGYIIRPAGDTVRGEVAMLGTQRSMRQCVFRTAPQPEATFRPEELRGYGIRGQKDFRVGTLRQADSTQTLRFMEVLVKGKATLLTSIDDNNNDRFFIQMAGQAKPEELRYIVRIVNDKGRQYRQELKYYQQALLVAFADYPALAPAIRQARYNVPDLSKVFQKYNANSGGAVQVNNSALARTRFRLGVVAGLPLSSELTISTPSPVSYYNVTAKSPLSPVGGLQLAFNHPRLSRRLWLQIGALYAHRNYAARAARGSAGTSIFDDYYDVQYEATFVHCPAVLRFEMGNGRLQPVIEAGISSNFRLSEAHNTYTINYTNNQTPTARTLFENSRTYEQGFLGGVGLTGALPGGHHATLMLRYEMNNGVSASTAISSICRTFYALLSYDLVGK